MTSPIGTATSMLIAVGVGGAVSQALEPDFVDIRQQSWHDNPTLVLEPGTLARLVAEGGVDLETAADQAEYSGVSGDRFRDLVYLAQQVPGLAELMFLWRLGSLTDDEWRFGMTKLGYRADFTEKIAETFTVPLTPAEAAIAIHHHVIRNQGQLPGLDLDTAGKVLRFPLVDIDGYASAEAYGMDNAQLDAITRTLGLPPGLDMVARMVFRGILDRGDFTLAALQSNRRTEWQKFEFEGYRQIPTTHEFTEGHLRGYLTEDEMYEGTAKHGMTEADTDLLYANAGRPLNIHQITTGLARGGKYGGTYDDVPAGPYRDAIIRGPLRPEFAALDYANRFNYPSAFTLRALAQAGDLGDEAAVHQILLEIGWPPHMAARVAAAWMAEANDDPHVARAKSHLWSTVQSAYVDSDADDAEATAALKLVVADVAAIPEVLELWKAARAIRRAHLTPSQVKKAVADKLKTPEEATERLLELGYSADDAAVLLAE